MRLNPYLLEYITADGRRLAFENDYVISKLEGLEVGTNISDVERFDGRGNIIISEQAEPLQIHITGVILGNKKSSKEFLLNIFQPKSRGRLIYNKRIKLEVSVSQSPSPERYRDNNLFELELYAGYPYWEDVKQRTVTIKGIEKRFQFPFNFVANKHMLGRDLDFNDVYVNGNAHKEYCLRVFARKACKNISILHNKENKKIVLLKEFVEGDKYIVDTRQNRLRVWKCDDGWNIVSEESTMLGIESEVFQLHSKHNVITLNAEQGLEHVHIDIQFYEIVAGVY